MSRAGELRQWRTCTRPGDGCTGRKTSIDTFGRLVHAPARNHRWSVPRVPLFGVSNILPNGDAVLSEQRHDSRNVLPAPRLQAHYDLYVAHRNVGERAPM